MGKINSTLFDIDIVEKDWEIDPLVKSLTLNKLFKQVHDFTKLIDKKSSKNNLHRFLSNNSYFFNNHLRIFSPIPLLSKIKLGSNYEIDFAICDYGSYGPEWKLIEIESPQKKLFNKNGDPSSTLNHAIRQAQDWQRWIAENLTYARGIFPMIEYPLCLIFMGRRSELTPDNAARLGRMNYEYRKSIHIHTLDNFIENALSVVNLIQRDGFGNWQIPMKAIKDNDWKNEKNKLSSNEEVIYYSKHNRIWRRDLKLLLKEREREYLNSRDNTINDII